MKRCPKCNRTYADDGFTFCLEDGALLSAPYDTDVAVAEPTLGTSGPPPTAVLSARACNKEDASRPASDAPTIASPASHHVDLPVSPETKARRRELAIAVLALIVIGGAISIYAIGKSYYCRKVIVSCTPVSGFSPYAYCRLYENGSVLEFLSPDNPSGINRVQWSNSGGTMDYHINYVTIRTPGLEGRQITVTPYYAADSWFCSNSSSTTFVAP